MTQAVIIASSIVFVREGPTLNIVDIRQQHSWVWFEKSLSQVGFCKYPEQKCVSSGAFVFFGIKTGISRVGSPLVKNTK